MIYFKRSANSAFHLVLLFTIFVFVLPSCKKDPKVAPYTVEVEVRDSAYIKTKDIYLWTDVLPSIQEFRPRDSKDIYEVMAKVRSYQPLDRFSFAETKEETERAQQGLKLDFGFSVKYFSSLTDLRVNYVYETSPAGLLGVNRGWKILTINGRALDGNKTEDVQYLNNIFLGDETSAAFTFQRPDGSTLTTNISKGVFPLNTVLYSNVYTEGSRRVGYLVYNEFSGPSSVQELVITLNDFAARGVNEMIVDLRYNRGGYVSTQDTLANMLAPQSVGRGQKVMYTYQFNERYSKYNTNTLWHKAGSLNLSRIVFIVTPATASASELLINNLKPVMAVKLVGEKNTFGKPVGFFPIPVFEYNIYPVSFRTVNSAGTADYYDGINVDKNTVDDLSRDFGDRQEASLKEALVYINTGGFSAFTQKRILSTTKITEEDLDVANGKLNNMIPKIEIENRPVKMPPPIRNLQL